VTCRLICQGLHARTHTQTHVTMDAEGIFIILFLTLHFTRRSYNSIELGLEEVVEEDFEQILEVSMVT